MEVSLQEYYDSIQKKHHPSIDPLDLTQFIHVDVPDGLTHAIFRLDRQTDTISYCDGNGNILNRWEPHQCEDYKEVRTQFKNFLTIEEIATILFENKELYTLTRIDSEMKMLLLNRSSLFTKFSQSQFIRLGSSASYEFVLEFIKTSYAQVPYARAKYLSCIYQFYKNND